MNAYANSSLDPKILKSVSRARVARLGTVNRDGTVHIVPIVFVCCSDTIYFPIDRKPKATTTKLKRLENIKANPQVTLLIDNYSEDWSNLSYILMYAKAKILSRKQENERVVAIKLLKKKYTQYRSNGYLFRNSPVVCMKIGRIVAWSAKSAHKSSLK